MKYTAHEINQMRDLVRKLAEPIGRTSWSPAPESTIEARLLTYMANETTVTELADELRAHEEADRAARGVQAAREAQAARQQWYATESTNRRRWFSRSD